MKKRLALMTVLFFGLAVVLASCAGMKTKPTEANFKTPVISLELFDVPQYDGYWYYAKSVKPTKGDPGDRGAPLPLSFLFDVQNPNPYPVVLDEVKYTVAFDKDFEVITTSNSGKFVIPAQSNDQVRVTTMVTVRSAMLSLVLANAVQLKAKGWDMWETLERWWRGVPEYSVPVTVKECAFYFTAGDVVKVVPFEATYP